MDKDLQYLNIEYDAETGILLCRWTKFIDTPHLMACHHQIFDMAITKGYHFLLVDIRSRGPSPQKDYDWYFNTFLPAKLRQFRGNNFLAFLVTPSHYAFVKEMHHVYEVDDAAQSATLTTQYFTEEQTASDWLRQAQLGQKLKG